MVSLLDDDAYVMPTSVDVSSVDDADTEGVTMMKYNEAIDRARLDSRFDSLRLKPTHCNVYTSLI